ncbi:hypothetical protein JKF63_00538 [Porcisia hertigi]|uniref:RRM domain-containing protein n=1 Tax=Porcisia hertigi TaxID=2761500 RepID=A0A836L6Z5_9TRYP|nr:hypothetical protein JKF63_00538 [Porcisia hertigi]
MFFLSTAAPPQVPPSGSIAAPAPYPFGTPMKEVSMRSFSNNESLSAPVSASPPSYEAVALNPKGPRSQTNLFVRKLASAVTEEDMRKLFERYGTILSFALMRDIHTGESLGTAFVRYSTHEEARAAMAALDGRELYGRQISIQWAKREHDSTPCGDARRKIRKLFVRNIPLDITVRHLRQMFSEFGAISNVTLHSDTAPAVDREGGGDNWHPPHRMRNIAFILFLDDDVAEQAVSKLHNTCPFESCERIPLMVKLAEDNRDRIDRKQRFFDNNAASVNTNMLATAMMQGSQLSTAPSLSPLVVPLSTPTSSTLSPPALPIDVNSSSHVLMRDGCVPSVSPNGQHTLPFAVAAPAPAPASTPMLHTTVDASRETRCVYVASAPNKCAEQQVLQSPSAPGQYMIASSGQHGFSVAKSVASQEPQSFYRTALSASVPQYYQTVTLPQVFVGPHGQPLQPQSNVFIPGFFPSFSPNHQSLQQPQQVPLFEMQGVPARHPLQSTPSESAQNHSPQQCHLTNTQRSVAISLQFNSAGNALDPNQTAIFSTTDSPLNTAISANCIPTGTDAKACSHLRYGLAKDDLPLATPMGEVLTPSFLSRIVADDEVIWGKVSAPGLSDTGATEPLC